MVLRDMNTPAGLAMFAYSDESHWAWLRQLAQRRDSGEFHNIEQLWPTGTEWLYVRVTVLEPRLDLY